MKPIVGIGCAYSGETKLKEGHIRLFNHVDASYQEAVYRYGGIPVILPPLREGEKDLDEYAEELMQHIDALYLPGGCGGGRKSQNGRLPLYEQQPVRSKWEDCLIRHAYAADIPTIGACRGHQMIAQALGGVIDPGFYPEHRQTVPDHEGIHTVLIEPGSRLAGIVGSEPWFVNSLHSQIVQEPPKGFIVSARTEAGTVEAIESTEKRFFMGTQFHPEMMLYDERARRFLAAFLAAAKGE